MSRWCVSLVALIALMATCNDAMAQRRQPLRNLARQLGVRWDVGHHWNNPGPNIDYYSPYSIENTPQHIPGNSTQTYDGTFSPNTGSQWTAPRKNSATDLLNQPQTQRDSGNHSTWRQPIIGAPAIEPDANINNLMTPYHQAPAQINSSSSIPTRPSFQNSILPSGRPHQNSSWNSKFGGYFQPNDR